MLHTGLDKADTKIVIKDENTNKDKKGANNKKDDAAAKKKETNLKEADDNKVINYETFESSSEDEYSCGAFESAAASFQNKEKLEEQN